MLNTSGVLYGIGRPGNLRCLLRRIGSLSQDPEILCLAVKAVSLCYLFRGSNTYLAFEARKSVVWGEIYGVDIVLSTEWRRSCCWWKVCCLEKSKACYRAGSGVSPEKRVNEWDECEWSKASQQIHYNERLRFKVKGIDCANELATTIDQVIEARRSDAEREQIKLPLLSSFTSCRWLLWWMEIDDRCRPTWLFVSCHVFVRSRCWWKSSFHSRPFHLYLLSCCCYCSLTLRGKERRRWCFEFYKQIHETNYLDFDTLTWNPFISFPFRRYHTITYSERWTETHSFWNWSNKPERNHLRLF